MINIKLIEEFLEVEHNKENTVGAYKYNLIKFGQYLGKDFTKALPKDLKLYIKNILVNEYAQQSLNQHVASIKGFYKYLYENEYVDKNYSLYIKPMDSKVVPQVREGREYFVVDEMKRLIDSIDNAPYVKKVKHKEFLKARDVAILTIAFKLGMRKSEIMETKISDIDFENMKITIDGSRRKNGETLVLPIDDEIVERVEKYLLERRAITLDLDMELFTTITGKKMYGSDMSRLLKKRFEESEIDGSIYFHKTRKSCSMALQGSGLSLQQTAKILGQKTSNVTFSNYTYLDSEAFIQNGLKLV